VTISFPSRAPLYGVTYVNSEPYQYKRYQTAVIKSGDVNTAAERPTHVGIYNILSIADHDSSLNSCYTCSVSQKRFEQRHVSHVNMSSNMTHTGMSLLQPIGVLIIITHIHAND